MIACSEVMGLRAAIMAASEGQYLGHTATSIHQLTYLMYPRLNLYSWVQPLWDLLGHYGFTWP